MRFTYKRFGIFVVSLSLSIVLLFLIHSYVYDDFSASGLAKFDLETKKRMHYSNYVYADLVPFKKRHPEVTDKSVQEKCTIFFEDFIKTHSDWSFPMLESQKYNKDIDKFEKIIKALGKQSKPSDFYSPFSRLERKTIKSDFKKHIDTTLATDLKMADAISLLRIYGHCFLNDANDMDQNLFNIMTRKLFPYLSFEVPTFEVMTRSNSTRFNNGIPELTSGYFEDKVLEPKSDDNLILFYQQNMNGRGIVLSAASRHAKDVARLIRLLRALNNKLPIQILHRSNFSNRSKTIVTEAAYESLEDAIEFSRSPFATDDITIDNLMHYSGSSYPTQTIIFTNIKPLVNGKLFTGYNNKLISLIFSSFEEIILLDADTVPLVQIEEFFKSQQYVESSTLYFKDRSLRDTNDYLETNFFQKLFPMNENSLDSLFDIPVINKTSLIANNYLRGYRHYQEAGVVVLNKKKHFLGTLMLLPLGIWKEPIKTATWGDKEHYWISLLMAGDTNFQFNEHETASVGVETPENLKTYDFMSHEVCSTHPGHLNSEGRLFWINSGFSYCKKNGHYRDREKYPFSKVPINELKEQYDSPLKITHALVPPSLPDLRDITDETSNQIELELKSKWKSKKKDLDEIKEFGAELDKTEKLQYAPQKGWVKNGICAGYYYCAYDRVESLNSGSEYDEGKFFQFDDDTIFKHNLLGKIWALDPPKPYRTALELPDNNPFVKPTKLKLDQG